mmetsp:Transcript_51358/g.120527  ORF Transcript_51358/g.120527 Transcript_51358/m.120527 type:complete len:145 (-) Transcript_51358:88-522(-)
MASVLVFRAGRHAAAGVLQFGFTASTAFAAASLFSWLSPRFNFQGLCAAAVCGLGAGLVPAIPGIATTCRSCGLAQEILIAVVTLLFVTLSVFGVSHTLAGPMRGHSTNAALYHTLGHVSVLMVHFGAMLAGIPVFFASHKGKC